MENTEKLISLLKEVDKEIKKLKEDGYVVEITLPSCSRYTGEYTPPSSLSVYRPISF